MPCKFSHRMGFWFKVLKWPSSEESAFNFLSSWVVLVLEGCYVWAQLSNFCGINQVKAFVCIQETSSVELDVALIARRSKGHACALHLGSKRHLCLHVPYYSLKQRLWGSREDQCHIYSCILGSSSMLYVKSGNISGSNVAIFLIENLESCKCGPVPNSLAHAHKHKQDICAVFEHLICFIDEQCRWPCSSCPLAWPVRLKHLQKKQVIY